MTIYLIRHTTPDVPLQTCYGYSDIGLAETFPRELHEIQKLVAHVVFKTVYSSPLERCSKLAGALFPDQEIINDERLMELNFGNWEMKKWDSISREETKIWFSDFVNSVVPGGESYLQLFERVISFYREIEIKKDATIAVVTHAGVLRSIVAYILDLPLERSFDITISHGAVIKIENSPNSFNKISFIKT